MKAAITVIIGSAMIFFSVSAHADPKYKTITLDSDYNHDKFGTEPQDIMRHFQAYTTSFDSDDDDNGDGTPDIWAIPHWVAYEIKAHDGELGKGPKRPRPWIKDKDLFEEGVAPADASYHFSNPWRSEHPDSPQLGYDRGHMCAKYHAYRHGKNADWNTHTFLNACPQRKDLNQGIWLDLENRTAGWADEYGSVWVVTGPVVFGNTPSAWLGQEGEIPVAMPDGFFKILIRESEEIEEPEVLAFFYPQEGIGYKKSGGYDHRPYLTSVDVIEALTGLDFLSNVPDDIEIDVERTIPVDLWE